MATGTLGRLAGETMTEDRPVYLTAPFEPGTLKRPHPDLEPWKCPSCGRMLAKIRLAPGSVIEIQCKSCKAFAIREAA